jgi:hypothetical protein
LLRGPGAFEKVHFFKRRAVFYAHLERRVGGFALQVFISLPDGGLFFRLPN